MRCEERRRAHPARVVILFGAEVNADQFCCVGGVNMRSNVEVIGNLIYRRWRVQCCAAAFNQRR